MYTYHLSFFIYIFAGGYNIKTTAPQKYLTVKPRTVIFEKRYSNIKNNKHTSFIRIPWRTWVYSVSVYSRVLNQKDFIETERK